MSRDGHFLQFHTDGQLFRAFYSERCCVKRDLDALFLAAKAFFLRLTLGFSKYWRLRTSDSMPAFSHCFLKRRKALSKGSFSFTLIPVMHIPSFLFDFEQVAWRGSAHVTSEIVV
jgi:hypothetical protein